LTVEKACNNPTSSDASPNQDRKTAKPVGKVCNTRLSSYEEPEGESSHFNLNVVLGRFTI